MRTITYDETKWQLVPKNMTQEMIAVFGSTDSLENDWKAMLDNAPETPAAQIDERAEFERLVKSLGVSTDRYSFPIPIGALEAKFHGKYMNKKVEAVWQARAALAEDKV